MAKVDTKLLEMLLKAGRITQKTFDDAVKMAEKGVQDAAAEIEKNLGLTKDDAQKILDKIDTPEKAVKLKGEKRQEYLAALDSVFGPREVRAKDMGFGDKTVYHGTSNEFDKFGTENIGASGRDHGQLFFATDDPRIAGDFAKHSAEIKNYGIVEDSNINSQIEELGEKWEKADRQGDQVGAWKLNDKIQQLEDKKSDLLSSGEQILPVRLRGNHTRIQGNGKFLEEDIISNALKNNPDKDAFLFKNFTDTPNMHRQYPEADILAVKNPEQIRSVNAAFDPRFKNSPLLMAGSAAMGSNFENPLNLLQPAVDAYEGAKNKISGTLAGQMDLTKDKSATPGIQEALNVVADPLNLLPGAAGVGAAAIQGMSQMTPKAPQPPFPMQAVEGLYKGGMIRPEVFQAYQKRFKPQGFADGGVIPGLVPDVGSMPIPTTDQITADLTAQGRMPVPEAKADLMTGLDDVYNQQRAAMPGMNFPQDQTVTGQTPAPPQPEGNFVNMVPKGQNADPAAMMKQMNAGVDPAFAAYEKALGLEGQAAMGQANAMTDYAKSAAQTIQDEQVKLEQMQAAQRLEWDKQVQKINEATQDYQNFKVDPNRIWANKSTGQKLGIAISLFFAGINGSDAGMQIINSAIDRDIEAQKAMMNAKREKIGFERGILSDMMARFGDERTAVQAAKVSALSIAELQLKAQTARMQGTAAHAQGLKGLAELQLKKAEAMQKFKDAYMLSPQYAKADQLTQKILQLPKDLQAKAWGEKASYDGIQTALKELDQVYGSAPYLSGKVPFTNAWKARDINAAKMFTLVKNIVGEKMSEGDKDLIDPFVPEDTDTPGQRAQKRNDFRAWLTNRVSERTPILTGLGAIPRMSLTFDERPAE